MKILWKIKCEGKSKISQLTWHFYYKKGDYTPSFLAKICKKILIKSNNSKYNIQTDIDMLNSIVNSDDDVPVWGSLEGNNTNNTRFIIESIKPLN